MTDHVERAEKCLKQSEGAWADISSARALQSIAHSLLALLESRSEPPLLMMPGSCPCKGPH